MHRSETAPRSHGIIHALRLLAAPPVFDARAPHAGGVAYRARQSRGIAPLADVYMPDGGGPHPSVIVVHGGGFVIGSRRMKPVRFLATRLAEAGFAVAAFDYRMIFRGGRLDEALDDLDAMRAWWHAQTDRFRLDQRRVSIAGFSAGATLALLHAAGATHGYERVVSLYGIYDFTYLGGRLAEWMRQLLLRSRDQAVWAARSPLAQCSLAAPMLLIHGTADTLVPVEHARRLSRQREALGLPVELREYAGEPHGFLNDASLAASLDAVAQVLRFLK